MSAADARPMVLVLNSPYQGRQFVITGPTATIGRSPECEIRLDLISISRRHATIQETAEGFVIRDLGSRNGVKINDIDMPEGRLRSGDVVLVGEVQLRFDLPAPAAGAAPPPSAAPVAISPAATGGEGERKLTGMDVIAAAQVAASLGAAQQPAPPPAEPETGPTRRLNLKLLFAAVLGMALALGVVFFAFKAVFGPAQDGQPHEYEVLLRVGEERWGRYPDERGAYGDFIEENVHLEDDTIAELRRRGPREFTIIGKSGGATTARIITRRGYRIDVRIIVRGRKQDELEELIERRLPPGERSQLAERFVRNGLLIREEQPYLAMREFEKAVAVLEPLKQKGLIYKQAKDLFEQARSEVDKAWEKLAGEIAMRIADKQYPAAVDLLDQAVEMIPDEDDPRHQKALRSRFGIIQYLERTERDRKRGR